MGKKTPNNRNDADRRVRQAERISRHLRVLRCIMGPGRWDALSLAKELEVSERTIHRILQALTYAQVPWYFCPEGKHYKVRDGFKFSGFEVTSEVLDSNRQEEIVQAARRMIQDAESLIASLRVLCDKLDTQKRSRGKAKD